jgi:hypothetical protein
MTLDPKERERQREILRQEEAMNMLEELDRAKYIDRRADTKRSVGSPRQQTFYLEMISSTLNEISNIL